MSLNPFLDQIKHQIATLSQNEREVLTWTLLKQIDDSQRDEDTLGTDRLVQALHGRKAVCADYLGGGNARMLHEAADRINAAQKTSGPFEPKPFVNYLRYLADKETDGAV